jgi:hypothetical protein
LVTIDERKALILRRLTELKATTFDGIIARVRACMLEEPEIMGSDYEGDLLHRMLKALLRDLLEVARAAHRPRPH